MGRWSIVWPVTRGSKRQEKEPEKSPDQNRSARVSLSFRKWSLQGFLFQPALLVPALGVPPSRGKVLGAAQGLPHLRLTSPLSPCPALLLLGSCPPFRGGSILGHPGPVGAAARGEVVGIEAAFPRPDKGGPGGWEEGEKGASKWMRGEGTRDNPKRGAIPSLPAYQALCDT